MRNHTKLIFIFIIFIITASVFAQTDTPSERPQDNACYTGGTMEGKCNLPTEAETLWAWMCGWYIARMETGLIPVDNVPDWCSSLLVNVSTSITTPGVVIPPVHMSSCYRSTMNAGPDIEFVASPNTYQNVSRYTNLDGTCSTFNATITLVYALDSASALAICQSLYSGFNAVISIDSYIYFEPISNDQLVGFYQCAVI
jgi:hypothetical protein